VVYNRLFQDFSALGPRAAADRNPQLAAAAMYWGQLIPTTLPRAAFTSRQAGGRLYCGRWDECGLFPCHQCGRDFPHPATTHRIVSWAKGTFRAPPLLGFKCRPVELEGARLPLPHRIDSDLSSENSLSEVVKFILSGSSRLLVNLNLAPFIGHGHPAGFVISLAPRVSHSRKFGPQFCIWFHHFPAGSALIA